jgi:hypothetical protein
MALNRTAYVARTAHNLKHVNRLNLPKCGVLKLFLVIGGKSSKSHLIPDAPPQKQEAKATDDFYFAPEKEKPKIKYVLDDKAGAITKATLRLFHRNNKTVIWEKELKGDELTDGEHEIEWDGKITKGTDFPESYITVEHSPYKLKMVVEADAGAFKYSPAAWTYIHVLVHSIELEKGVKEALSRQLDKDLFDTYSVPAEKAKQEVRLVSNLYSKDMTDKGNGTSFTEYRDLWKSGSEEGPNIPIFAKLFIKDSADAKADVPKAIGRVRLLWDWRDSPEDLSIHFKEAKEYLTDTLNYDKKATHPKGDNCHKDRGGKRGDDTKPVFPARDDKVADAAALTAGKFPFKVDRCGTRKTSSYSETWRTGKLIGKTGVLFQPSHIAGDAYLVDAYFPHNRKPDGKDDLDTNDDKLLDHAIKKSTGAWEIWREIHVSQYLKKDASLPNLSFPTVATTLAKAYMKLEDKSGGAKSPMAGYDGKIRAHLAAEAAEKRLAVKAGDQGTITKGGIRYVARAAFVAALQAAKGSPAAATAWLTANGAATAAGYSNMLEAITDVVVVKTCDEYVTASDGVKVFHLEPYWSADGGLQSTTGGFASVDFPTLKAAADRKRAAYIHGVLTPPPSIKEIAAHEIGHTLFLPHAPGRAGGPAAAHDQVAHWKNCMMSYEFDREMKFCGLCLLRLRGWDHRVLNSNRSLNKK